MTHAITLFCLATFMHLSLPAQALAAKDPHHILWTNRKGKAKCTNKSNREKADKCADKLRSKGHTHVQVIQGKCAVVTK